MDQPHKPPCICSSNHIITIIYYYDKNCNYHTGEAVDIIFTKEPNPLDICNQNGRTIFLQWKAQYESCDWSVTDVKTMKYLLYPIARKNLPPEIYNEINATVNYMYNDCPSGRIHIDINVTMTPSLQLSEYIPERIPYIVCIITFTDGDNQKRSENLSLEAYQNCFNPTTGNQSTESNDGTSLPISNATTMEIPDSLMYSVTSYASCILHCNISFINISYYVMCVLVTILLDVLEL